MNGRLGAWELFKGVPQSVYACQTDEYTTITVNIVNRNWTPVKVKVAVTDVAHVANLVDYIEYDVELPAKGQLERTGVIVPQNKFLTVETDSDNVNCVCWGVEIGASDPAVLERNSAPAVSSFTFVAGSETTLDPQYARPAGTTFSVTGGSIPNGMSLNSSTGVISGTPVTTSYNASGIATTADITAVNSTENFNTTTTINFNKQWLDGETAAKAAPSAQWIKTTTGINTDGVYWIDLPVVGPQQVYCLMNDNAAGGGWMMAMKATRGYRFDYDSVYWTTNELFNPESVSRSDADAKFEVFNRFPATRIAAVFPDTSNGGRMASQGGWTWNEALPTVVPTTLREYFARGDMYTYLGGGNGAVTNDAHFSGGPFSAQSGWQQYALNYKTNYGNRARWGYGWNNESEQASNDVEGGIGLARSGASAGDFIYCCQSVTGVNRTMRFELYVR